MGIKRVTLAEARPGDILTFKRAGSWAAGLSWLIWKLKAPWWLRWEWHMAPVVAATDSDLGYIDAQFPRVTLSKVSKQADGVHAYRIMDEEPPPEKSEDIIRDLVGKPYDFLVYPWTALRQLGVPIPRIVNRSYDCWECAWEAADQWGHPLTDNWNYPFITDFKRLAGER